MSHEVDVDRVRATIYGQAIGDSLGLPVEFQSAKAIQTRLETWNDEWPKVFRATTRTNSTWKAGEWSDDTEQACCLLDAYLEGVETGRSPADTIDVRLVSKHFLNWGVTNGRGMGNHTGKVFEHFLFPLEPLTASEDIWEQSGRQAAPNGAVMRTAYVGLLRPWDLDWTTEVAAECAAVTHFDPRCKASAVAVSVAIAELVMGAPVNEAVAHAAERAFKYDEKVPALILHGELADLKLDEGLDGHVRGSKFPPIGFTYKCLGAAFWALRNAQALSVLRTSPRERFRKALEAVIMAGGDTDTNGAVAGAILGAHLGMDGLPPVLVAGLTPRETLDRGLVRLLSMHARR